MNEMLGNIINPPLNENGNVVVKVSQIMKKLRTYQDRKNFALENSKFIIINSKRLVCS
jgi:DNA integrity scanning protein DisA with diadenylate cyclase activity